MPKVVGFLGTGKITGAVVRGLVGCDLPPERIVVSPRNRERSAELAREIPIVEVASDNQAVVDASDTIFLAVRPGDAPEIIPRLEFREAVRVISLLPTIRLTTLAKWVAPARSIFRACPLPSCAFGRGPILAWGDDPESRALLSRIGDLVVASTEDELHRIWVISGVISPLYDVLGSLADWTRAGGVDRDTAERYVASMTKCLCDLRLQGAGDSFPDLAAEAQTPGGLNEQAARMIREARAPEAFAAALDALLARFESALDS